MKKKGSYKNWRSRAFDFAIYTAVLSIVANTVFAVLVLISHDTRESYVLISIGFVMLMNIACLVMILNVRDNFNKRLKTKIAEPLSSVKRELDNLIRGEFAKPELFENSGELEGIYDALETIRIKIDEYTEQQRNMKESKSVYISGLMHDIATPITRINGCASMINDGLVTEPEDIKRLSEMIVQNTEDISIMLDNLKEIEKYDKTVIGNHLLPIDISSVLSRYSDDLKFELEKQKVSLTFTDKCSVVPVCMIDIKSCKRVLMNLINNSINYKKPDTACRINMILEIKDKTTVQLTVSDNGIGADVECLDKMFDMFFRGDSSRHNVGEGNGIGLFVSKQIIESNNGKIWADNNGNGLDVFISLPLVDEPPVKWYATEEN